MLKELRGKVKTETDKCYSVPMLNLVLQILKSHNDKDKIEIISENKMLTVSEVAKELNISKQTIRKYIHNGSLKANKLDDNKSNSKFIIYADDLNSFKNRF